MLVFASVWLQIRAGPNSINTVDDDGSDDGNGDDDEGSDDDDDDDDDRLGMP